MLGNSTVTIWLEDTRQLQLCVNAATTLREVMALPEVRAVFQRNGSEPPLLAFDGSLCGEAVPLTAEKFDSTLQSLGWFPSGVLVLRRRCTVDEITSVQYDKAPPSVLLRNVTSRHDEMPALDVGRGGLNLATTAAAAKIAEKRDVAFAKVDSSRLKSARARDKRTATLLWHMLAKRCALGRASLREEDRFYFVVDRGEQTTAMYVFFAMSTLAGHALADICSYLGVEAACKRLRSDQLYLDNLRRIADQIHQFDIVRVVDAPAATELTEKAEEESLAAAAPLIPSEAPHHQSSQNKFDMVLVVKFGPSEYHITGLTPASTVSELKHAIAVSTGLNPAKQKLVCKAAHLLDDPARPLAQTGLQPNSRIILMTSKPRR